MSTETQMKRRVKKTDQFHPKNILNKFFYILKQQFSSIGWLFYRFIDEVMHR